MAIVFEADAPDIFGAGLVFIRGPMGKVEPYDIDAGLDQAVDGCFRFRRRTHGGDDLGSTLRYSHIPGTSVPAWPQLAIVYLPGTRGKHHRR